MPGQPVSVRTVRQGWTDWSPVIATTDSAGRWSIGGKLAIPGIQFSVNRALPEARYGVHKRPQHDAEVRHGGWNQAFTTPSAGPFRTPDGRLATGRPQEQTPEQYRMDIPGWRITVNDAAGPFSVPSARLGDRAADLISELIGPNALSEKETENVLLLIRVAFEKPQTIAPDARTPSRTLAFLQRLAETTDDNHLRQQIADTIAYIQAR